MPFLRGGVYAPVGASRETVGFLVVTNDRWNHTMSSIGVLPLRTSVADYDRPFSVTLPNGHIVVTSRLISDDLSLPEHSYLGAAHGALDADSMAAAEDQLRDFLQLPQLLQPAPRIVRPPGDASAYAVWGQVYKAGPLIKGERKRFVTFSPSAWNAVSDMALLVRTTTSFARRGDEFPQIQGGSVRACCGDATTLNLTSVLLNPRDRPMPSVATMPDMQSIARGLVVTHDLSASLLRIGIGP